MKKIATAIFVLLMGAGVARADQCILDDLIVDGSACIGFDCVCNMSFGFDTLILKENNTRMLFDDTSSSASFPNNDWRLTANDSSNGGGNYFSIDDASAGRQVFKVEAGARANALYVENDGDIGIGTANPAVDLDIVTGNTPTVRLQQDGSSGFTPQSWDLAGNETNFFLRDVTNGSRLPFRSRPGAPTSSIDISASGDVGIGTASPSGSVHVRRTDTDALDLLYLENGGATRIAFINTMSTADWRFNHANNGDFRISSTTAGTQFELDPNGDLTLTGTLNINGGVGGGCTGCDEVFQPGYPIDSIDDHAQFMWENSYLEGIGPSPVDAPIDVFRKTAGILNELEKAHIYIEQLHHRLSELEKQILTE